MEVLRKIRGIQKTTVTSHGNAKINFAKWRKGTFRCNPWLFSFYSLFHIKLKKYNVPIKAKTPLHGITLVLEIPVVTAAEKTNIYCTVFKNKRIEYQMYAEQLSFAKKSCYYGFLCMFQYIMTVREKKIHTDSGMEQTYAKKSTLVCCRWTPLFPPCMQDKNAWSSLLNLVP